MPLITLPVGWSGRDRGFHNQRSKRAADRSVPASGADLCFYPGQIYRAPAKRLLRSESHPRAGHEIDDQMLLQMEHMLVNSGRLQTSDDVVFVVGQPIGRTGST